MVGALRAQNTNLITSTSPSETSSPYIQVEILISKDKGQDMAMSKVPGTQAVLHLGIFSFPVPEKLVKVWQLTSLGAGP